MEIIEQSQSRIRAQAPISRALRERYVRDFLPRWNEKWDGKPLLHGRPPGPNAVRLDGNDYLSITGHPDVVQAQISAMMKNSGQVIQSGVFLINEHPIRALESSLSDWLGKEDGFVCQSGYMANLGLLQAIADAQTPVYLDAMAHASLWEGARAARAPMHAFRHNDSAHLERLIHQHGPGIIVVDSVYSTTGAKCPLPEFVQVCEQTSCMILVDESHSLGTHGPQGAGLCAELGLTDRVHFISASLAKAFAGRAGYFSVPKELRYFILSESFPNIFSSCLLPHEIAGLSATLKVVKESEPARQRLHANARRLRAQLAALGYPTYHGTEQIIALETGTEPGARQLRDGLEERGVFGSIFCAPATSRNRALVRLTLNASLTDAELSFVEKVARDLAPLIRPWEWPAARRSPPRETRFSHEPA